MDPVTTDLPPMTVDHAGTPAVNTHPAHPPYAEMINNAISALKDRDGSSRQAISKYIEKEYPNLPPTHSVMLTHHLKRLKNLGQLIMVKHSYMLPNSTTLDFNPPHPPVNNNFEHSPSALSKRKPGRPPKLTPVVPGLGVVPNQLPTVQPFDANANTPQFPYNVGVVGQDLRITDGSGVDFQGNSTGVTSEPLFASLGLADDGVPVPSPLPKDNTPVVAKRGRGRPPKSSNGGRPPKSSNGGRPPKSSNGGRPPKSSGGRLMKKKAGRPPKSSGVGNDEGETQVNVAGSGEGESQGVERPVKKPKMMSVMAGNGVRAKKGRGRPRRLGIGAVTVPLSGNLLMPRARPKRVAKPVVSVNGGVGETVPGSRKPARKFTGKRVGRPSKVGSGTAVLVTDPRQLVVYQELKRKYDLLQSKAKQVASMVRPCIDPDFGKTALGALQELEALAGGVEVNNAPSHGQTQEPETEPLPQN